MNKYLFGGLLFLSGFAQSECPNYPYETLVGTWQNEQIVELDGSFQRWTTIRKKDGTYHITFERELNGEVKTNTESGLWSYSRCLYTVIVEQIDNKPVNYQEVYRVNDINDSYMEYTNFRTDNLWKIYRISN